MEVEDQFGGNAIILYLRLFFHSLNPDFRPTVAKRHAFGSIVYRFDRR